MLSHQLSATVVATLALAPGLARADQLTVTETDGDSIINIAECKGTAADNLTFAWTVSLAASGGTYRLLASDTSGCSTSSSSDAVTKTLATQDVTTTSGSHPSRGSVGVATVLQSLGISCTGSATTVYFCLVYTPPTSSSSTATTLVGGVNLDLAVPPAPVAATPAPGDAALYVSWTDGTADTSTEGTPAKWRIVATAQTGAKDAHEVTVTSSDTARVGGLTNGVIYDVVVYALTEGGNASAASNVVSGTPVPVDDFWDLYRKAGGVEAGGCAAAGGSPFAVAALAVLALRRRSRR